jgi:hypothetical protein
VSNEAGVDGSVTAGRPARRNDEDARPVAALTAGLGDALTSTTILVARSECARDVVKVFIRRQRERRCTLPSRGHEFSSTPTIPITLLLIGVR